METTNETITLHGREYSLRLTLGALAEIEEALGVDNLASLATRLANPAAADLLVILSALLRAGGAAIAMDELKAADLSLRELAQMIARVFAGAFAGGEGMPAGKPPAPSAGPDGAGSDSA